MIYLYLSTKICKYYNIYNINKLYNILYNKNSNTNKKTKLSYNTNIYNSKYNSLINALYINVKLLHMHIKQRESLIKEEGHKIVESSKTNISSILADNILMNGNTNINNINNTNNTNNILYNDNTNNTNNILYNNTNNTNTNNNIYDITYDRNVNIINILNNFITNINNFYISNLNFINVSNTAITIVKHIDKYAIVCTTYKCILIVDMSNMHVINIIKDTHEIWACDVILHDSNINDNNINNNMLYIVYGSTNKKCYFVSYNTVANKISSTHTISNKNIVRDISIIRENNTYLCLIANRDKTLKKYTLYGELVSIIHKNIDIRIIYNIKSKYNINNSNNINSNNNINNILIGTYNGNIYYYTGYHIKRIHNIELGGKVIAIHYNNYNNSIYYGNDNKLYNYIAIGGKDNEILIYNINNSNNILSFKLFNHNDNTINIYNIDRRTYIHNLLNNITYTNIYNKYNINSNKAMLESYIHNDAYVIVVTLYGEVILYCVNKHRIIYRHRIGMICKCSILYNNILYIGTERGMIIMDIESKIIDNNIYNNSIIHILEEYKILKIELNNNIDNSNNTNIDNIILIICMDINTYEIYIKRINRY